jgi:hypothetical protein
MVSTLRKITLRRWARRHDRQRAGAGQPEQRVGRAIARGAQRGSPARAQPRARTPRVPQPQRVPAEQQGREQRDPHRARVRLARDEAALGEHGGQPLHARRRDRRQPEQQRREAAPAEALGTRPREREGADAHAPDRARRDRQRSDVDRRAAGSDRAGARPELDRERRAPRQRGRAEPRDRRSRRRANAHEPRPHGSMRITRRDRVPRASACRTPIAM